MEARAKQGLDDAQVIHAAVLDAHRAVQEECAAIAARAIEEIHRLDPSRSVEEILAQLTDDDEGA